MAVLLLGTVSALVYAAAAVAQRGAAARTALPEARGYRRSGIWWTSLLLNALGALLHTAALRYGSLVAVQMLGVLTLVAAPVLSAALLRSPMSAEQWRGTALTVAGVAGLLVLTRSAGSDRAPDTGALLGAVLLTAGVLGVTTAAAGVTRRGPAASLWYAAAAGVAFAAASALAQVAVLELADGDGLLRRVDGGLPWPALLAGAGVVCLAPAGLALCQLGYRGGLEAPLATVTLVNPVFATLIGVVFGDRYPTDLGTALAALVAAVAAGRGVCVLAKAEAREGDQGRSGGRRAGQRAVALERSPPLPPSRPQVPSRDPPPAPVRGRARGPTRRRRQGLREHGPAVPVRPSAGLPGLPGLRDSHSSRAPRPSAANSLRSRGRQSSSVPFVSVPPAPSSWAARSKWTSRDGVSQSMSSSKSREASGSTWRT